MDANTSLKDLEDKCGSLGIDCIAIADHGTTEGALKFKNISRLKIIVGEEILTTHGEIMGLFLQETIPNGVSPDKAVSEIKLQDGLVLIPHPFDSLRKSSLNKDIALRLAKEGLVDIVEIINSRAMFERSTIQAKEFAEEFKLLKSGGSDAHSVEELGLTYVEMEDFIDAQSFLKSLAAASIIGTKASPFVRFRSLTNRIRKSLKVNPD
jgi:predicted metal-dependent phosphoesterase TrpH